MVYYPAVWFGYLSNLCYVELYYHKNIGLKFNPIAWTLLGIHSSEMTQMISLPEPNLVTSTNN